MRLITLIPIIVKREIVKKLIGNLKEHNRLSSSIIIMVNFFCFLFMSIEKRFHEEIILNVPVYITTFCLGYLTPCGKNKRSLSLKNITVIQISSYYLIYL
jgi:hypothetical protein